MGMLLYWGALACTRVWGGWVVMGLVWFGLKGGNCQKAGFELLPAENWIKSSCWGWSSQVEFPPFPLWLGRRELMVTPHRVSTLHKANSCCSCLSACQFQRFWRPCSFAFTPYSLCAGCVEEPALSHRGFGPSSGGTHPPGWVGRVV